MRRFLPGDLHLVILALLSRQPMHGYQLMGELADRLGPRYRPSPGSIYPALQSLSSEGLIAAVEEGDRRTYELTSEGATAFVRRADRIATVEARFGVRFASGLEVVLARFKKRVWAAAQGADESAIEAILERAATEIEMLPKGGQ